MAFHKSIAQHIPELAPRSLEPRGSHQTAVRQSARLRCDRAHWQLRRAAHGVLQASNPRGMFGPANVRVHVPPTLVQHSTCPLWGGATKKVTVTPCHPKQTGKGPGQRSRVALWAARTTRPHQARLDIGMDKEKRGSLDYVTRFISGYP